MKRAPREGKRLGRGLVGIVATLGVAGAAQAAEPIIEKLEHGEVNWSEKTVISTGSGAPNLKLKNVAQVRLAAERAAKLDAYRNVVETLKGVKITAAQTGESALSRGQVRTQVEGILRRCKTVDTRYFSDGGVDLVIKCALDGGLATALAPAGSRLAVKTEGDATYSGLIVDASGTKAQPALAPKVVDDGGKAVYAAAMVGPSFLRQHGAASYARSVEEAKQNGRVGKAPLVVRATALGDVGSDIRISAEDAAKLAQANQTFLAEARVVIVTDGP